MLIMHSLHSSQVKLFTQISNLHVKIITINNRNLVSIIILDRFLVTVLNVIENFLDWDGKIKRFFSSDSPVPLPTASLFHWLGIPGSVTGDVTVLHEDTAISFLL